MDHLFDLTGKVAIVTGSTRGIGSEIAEALAHAGADVVISSRSYLDSQTRANQITRLHNNTCIPFRCDVTNKEDNEQLVYSTLNYFNRLDIVVANAGSNSYVGSMTELDDYALHDLTKINLQSAIWLAKYSKNYLTSTNGSFIYIGSISGLLPNTLLGTYGLVKAAGHHFVRNLAAEWGTLGVRVNGIAPGVIKTDLSKGWLEDRERLERIKSRTLLGRIGYPREVAGAAVFLASQAASFITGQILVVDGGLSKNT